MTVICSTVLAAGVVALGLVVALAATGVRFGQGHGIAGMTAGMTLLASWLLFGLDRLRWWAKRFEVRRRLASRVETSMREFAASFAPPDRELALYLRDRLATYFDEPAARIAAQDRLEDFEFEGFMPGIYFFLMTTFCENYGIDALGTFPKSRLSTVGDLVAEAKVLLRERQDEVA